MQTRHITHQALFSFLRGRKCKRLFSKPCTIDTETTGSNERVVLEYDIAEMIQRWAEQGGLLSDPPKREIIVKVTTENINLKKAKTILSKIKHRVREHKMK